MHWSTLAHKANFAKWDHGQDWWVYGHTLNTQLLLQLEILFKRCMVECGKSQSYLKCQLLKSETFSSGQNRWHYPTELQTPVKTTMWILCHSYHLPSTVMSEGSDVWYLRVLVLWAQQLYLPLWLAWMFSSLSTGPWLDSSSPFRAHWNWAGGLDSAEQDRVRSDPDPYSTSRGVTFNVMFSGPSVINGPCQTPLLKNKDDQK
jgi:hypothetical protein